METFVRLNVSLKDTSICTLNREWGHHSGVARHRPCEPTHRFITKKEFVSLLLRQAGFEPGKPQILAE
jgi:hypothetical protein